MTARRVIRWEEPPPSRSGGEGTRGPYRLKPDPWQPIADELRGSPGRWGVIQIGASGTTNARASHVRGGLGVFAPAGSFEAASRKLASGECLVYARYVGEPVVPGRSES